MHDQLRTRMEWWTGTGMKAIGIGDGRWQGKRRGQVVGREKAHSVCTFDIPFVGVLGHCDRFMFPSS